MIKQQHKKIIIINKHFHPLRLTVDLECVDLAVDHEVWFEEDVAHQLPVWLLIGVGDGLTHDAERHQYDQQDDDEVDHVFHLQRVGSHVHRMMDRQAA